jgi:hypothetical protein
VDVTVFVVVTVDVTVVGAPASTVFVVVSVVVGPVTVVVTEGAPALPAKYPATTPMISKTTDITAATVVPIPSLLGYIKGLTLV